MGHATAEAVVRAGLTLVPYSLTGLSEAVAVGNVGIHGIPVELVGPPERQAALDRIRRWAWVWGASAVPAPVASLAPPRHACWAAAARCGEVLQPAACCRSVAALRFPLCSSRFPLLLCAARCCPFPVRSLLGQFYKYEREAA